MQRARAGGGVEQVGLVHPHPGQRAALAGDLVTFGILPTRPETGFGYLHRGEAIGDLVQRIQTRVAQGVHFLLTDAGLCLTDLSDSRGFALAPRDDLPLGHRRPPPFEIHLLPGPIVPIGTKRQVNAATVRPDNTPDPRDIALLRPPLLEFLPQKPLRHLVPRKDHHARRVPVEPMHQPRRLRRIAALIGAILATAGVVQLLWDGHNGAVGLHDMLWTGKGVASGWAGLSCWAAKHYGVTVHGVTLSQAQLDYGRAKVERLGLQDKVTLELKDYRQVEGQCIG